MVWDGKRWRMDDVRHMDIYAIDIVKAIWEEARKVRDRKDATKEQDEYAEALGQWAARCENPTAIRAMQQLSKHMVASLPLDYDSEPWMLNCPHGIVDLETGEMKVHDSSYCFTKMTAGSPPKKKAKPKRWLKFLEWLWDGDQSMIDFIQRAAGYTLTGSQRAQAWFFCFGVGDNGKSTFLNAMRYAMGDYAYHAQDDVFLEHRRDSHPTAIAMLKGFRMVTAIESEEGKGFNMPLLKQITGGDPITARYCNKDPFTFQPECKVWIACNDKPNVRSSRHGTWRRIMTIPFMQRVKDSERDRDLDLRLRKERNEILGWMLEGTILYREKGLEPPEVVRAATEAYRQEMDYVGAFIEEVCFVSNGTESPIRIAQSELYDSYRGWCLAGGCKTMTKISFGKELSERGFRKLRIGRQREWDGLELKEKVPF